MMCVWNKYIDGGVCRNPCNVPVDLAIACKKSRKNRWN